jgi:hypothetical protein
MISVTINVSKVNKEYLYEGKNGKYLNVVLFPLDAPDQFGNNYKAVQGLTKEQRAAGLKGNILGSGRTMGGSKPTSGGEDVL